MKTQSKELCLNNWDSNSYQAVNLSNIWSLKNWNERRRAGERLKIVCPLSCPASINRR